MKRILLAGALVLGLCPGAWAQNAVVNFKTSNTTPGSKPVTDTLGLPVNVIAGSLTASLAPFGPSASGSRGTPLSVATSDSSGSLPTGAAVVVSNVGANPMYCNVAGVAATTSDQYISASGGWFVFAPGVVTTLHCIATGSTTTANMVGGSGLPAGTGGGSGSTGGGAVYGPTAVGSANANPPVVIGGTATGAAGQNVEGVAVKPASTAALQTDLALVDRNPDLGTIGDSAWVSGNGTGISIWKTIANNTGSAIPVGSAIIGKVGIDQTTPGTTNLVQTPTTTNGGAATIQGGVGVVNGGNYYVTVAASQTSQVLQSSTGATGDYLSHCVIQPTTTAAGTVIVYDNSTAIFTFTTGTLSNLVPFTIPVGAVSRSGAWKVTTGANETATCVGKFS